MDLRDAEAVVGQHLDHATIFDLPVSALADHALHLCAQCGQTGDLEFDIGEMRPRDPVGLLTRLVRIVAEGQKLTDRLDLEPKLAGVTDEAETTHSVQPIGASIVLGPIRGR